MSIQSKLWFSHCLYGCESWTIKKEAQKNWYSWTVVLEKTWESRRSNQSILKEINPEIHWKDWCWRWKLQYFGYLIWKADSLEKTLMLTKTEGRRRRGCQRKRWLDGITDLMDTFEQALGDGEGQGSLACCSPWGWKESVMTEWLNNNNH